MTMPFKNVPDIMALGDAFEVGYRRSRRESEAVHLDERPGGRMAVVCHLPRPFYRYRALSPKNYISKLETRSAMITNPERHARWRAELDAARSAMVKCGGQSHVFWGLMRPFLKRSHPPWKETTVRPMTRVTTHPAGARHLLGHFAYKPDASLAYLEMMDSV